MKIKIVVLVVICFTMLFPQTVNASATAEDVAWKECLRDFLVNNFPSLFDEATIKKNEELFELWKNGYYRGDKNGSAPEPDSIPIDAIFSPWEDSTSKWIPQGPYYPLLLPHECKFYDLDNDNIPEIVVSFPSRFSEGGHDFIYKLNGTNYEPIYSELNSVYMYKNSQNILVVFEGFYVVINAVYFAEIQNGKLIFSDYIDSNGNNMLDGIKYNNITEETDMWEFMQKVIENDNLTPLVEFDVSDVVDAIKNDTLINPKTGDNYFMFFILIPVICFLFAKIKFMRGYRV